MNKIKSRFKYLKIAIGIGISLSIISLSLRAAYFYMYRPMSSYERHFENALINVIRTNKDFVYLKNLTDFEWERVCIVFPYAEKKDVEKILGFKYGDYDKLYWIANESIITLLFVDERQNVTPLRLRRWKMLDYGADYYGSKGRKYEREHTYGGCVIKNNAQFVFYRIKTTGKRVFELVDDKYIINSIRGGKP
jgi:hypothetical protein